MGKRKHLGIRTLIPFLIITGSLVNSVTATSMPQISVTIDVDKFHLDVFSNSSLLKRYPVAVGKPETPTPIGNWVVINKYEDWGGGFGSRWIGLNVPWGYYGIHGTNKPLSIGKNTSSGCIRMHNQDVEDLYELIRIGTPVKIVGHSTRDFRRIAEGDIGADVWIVQSCLFYLGLYAGKIDGRFGDVTEQAVKRFESANKLPVDGVVSLNDYHKLGLED